MVDEERKSSVGDGGSGERFLVSGNVSDSDVDAVVFDGGRSLGTCFDFATCDDDGGGESGRV